MRKATIVAIAGVIVLGVACRSTPPAPAPLQPDPEVAQRLERQKEAAAREERARNLTAADVIALEASLKRSAEDFDTLRMLRSFYRASGAKVFGWNEMVARRRPHIVWLIENHPERDEALWFISADADPVGYAEAKSRWLAHTNEPDAPEAVLSNAAAFFGQHDPRLAEQLLLRARGQAPPDRVASFSSQLGYLYAGVINGPRSPKNGAPLTPFDSDPYARQLREQLLQSEDARVMASAGEMLSRTFQDEERRQLGIRLLERALELDPSLARTRQTLIAMREHDRMQAIRARPLSDLPLNDRLVVLSRTANGNFDLAEDMASYAPTEGAGTTRRIQEGGPGRIGIVRTTEGPSRLRVRRVYGQSGTGQARISRGQRPTDAALPSRGVRGPSIRALPEWRIADCDTPLEELFAEIRRARDGRGLPGAFREVESVRRGRTPSRCRGDSRGQDASQLPIHGVSMSALALGASGDPQRSDDLLTLRMIQRRRHS